MSAIEAINQSAWQWLQRELDLWSAENKIASLWWRDDDAVDKTSALTQLLELHRRSAVPLALALIPSRLQPRLASVLAHEPGVRLLQHGYSHSNYAAAGQKKLELAADRDPKQIEAELKLGFKILAEGFGDCFTPVLVPPWNRIDTTAVSLLAAIGFRGLSTMRVRKTAYSAPGILQVNTHLDPINWRHGGGFIGTYAAIAILIQHLQARRTGYRDLDEPSGILSHHLVQNQATWEFIERLFKFLSDHPAVYWLDAKSIWSRDPG